MAFLDGDQVRKSLSPDLGFTQTHRETQAKIETNVSKLLARNWMVAIVALAYPCRSFREAGRQTIGYFEVFVNAPLDECIKRDVKGIYKRALAWRMKDITGIQDTYEESEYHEITMCSNKVAPEEAANFTISKLRELKY